MNLLLGYQQTTDNGQTFGDLIALSQNGTIAKAVAEEEPI